MHKREAGELKVFSVLSLFKKTAVLLPLFYTYWKNRIRLEVLFQIFWLAIKNPSKLAFASCCALRHIMKLLCQRGGGNEGRV